MVGEFQVSFWTSDCSVKPDDFSPSAEVTLTNPGKSLRILVVDDEEIVADSLARILNDKGFAAKAVYSGEDALESATNLKPDALISDVIMPGISGIELAMRISKQYPACRIVLFSALTMVSNLLKASGAENCGFTLLAKPVHPDDLVACLAT
ncbi:MAG TPA: response regulator [Terracidiphilus sp.]|jgi:CheY-like chemotaxis protein|nr:response regulator [Terracidiphilus sp.]